MNVKKLITSNNIFLIIQTTLFVVDVILSFIFDIKIYFLLLFFMVAITVLYNAVVQSLFTQKVVYKNKDYSKILRKHPCIFTDAKIYLCAKRMKDDDTKKVLGQGFISILVLLFNIFAILLITFILHPENIG